MAAPELVDVERIAELRLWDMVDEGVFVVRICLSSPQVANNAVVAPVRSSVPDFLHERVILESDLPFRVVRGLRPG